MKRELWLNIVVRDRNGKITHESHRKADSILQQWNEIVYAHMAQVARTTNDTGGTPRSLTAHVNDLDMRAAAGTITYGIVVGLGSNAVTLADFALQTPVAEGTGLNQMNYAVTTVGTSVVASPLCGFIVTRVATNNSALDITVTESAIYVRIGATPWYSCIVRDVFAGILVAVGGSITVNWTLQVTA